MIPDDIVEIINYLAASFGSTIADPAWSSEDIQQHLYVLYFENLSNKTKIKNPEDKNEWFIFFKCRMIDLYRKLNKERNRLQKLLEATDSWFYSPDQEKL